ncbi:N-arachidonyl glycine receptor-like [Homarus americanus]|uniref:N-arachidonyl glycine receptor-like n=1 Tax=Homarus americanus TaxID=6706 RepID=UPI001C46C733|nr:N-arachidonyl glycine receptor-like [Homarus americanus]XP_042216203.1 N-arachidonyl glycine receptor-like [Homarus americanus]
MLPWNFTTIDDGLYHLNHNMTLWNTTISGLNNSTYYNHHTLHSYHQSQPPALWALILGVCMAGAVALVGGVCNLGAIVVLLKEGSRRRPGRPLVVVADTILLIQLAVVDLLYCSITLPIIMVTYLRPEPLPYTFCATAGFIRIANANVEFNTLGLVAIERFYHIKRGRSVGGGLFSVKLTRLYCLCLWAVGVLFQVPFVATGQYGFNQWTYKCDLIIGRVTRVVMVLGEVLLPLLVILGCYIAILYRVRHSKTLLAKYMDGHESKRGLGGQPIGLMRRYKAASRSLLGIVVMYLVCILPVSVYNIVGQDGSWKEAGIILYSIYWLQYIANTIIYVMSNIRYRVALRVFMTMSSGNKLQRGGTAVRVTTGSRIGQFNSYLNLKRSSCRGHNGMAGLFET